MSRFALVIANTEYIDSGLAKLSSPGKDAEEFARVLKSQDICAFDDVKILLNQPEPIIREAIDDFFTQKKCEDLLILYFSGHGVRDELGELYLAVSNTNRFRLRSTAIKSDFIRESMAQSRSKRQVLILDCCNSGAFAHGTKATTGGSVGTASAFEGNGYGHIVLTASDSTQFAWEGDKILGTTENSLFTHFLVKGLEGEADRDGDGRITIDELYEYAYEQIINVTSKQTPSKWSYKEQGEIVLRQNTRIENIKAVPLPMKLLDLIDNPFPEIRLGVVKQLAELLNGRNHGLSRSARETLERIVREDDSRRVTTLAIEILESSRQKEKIVKRVVKEECIENEQGEAGHKATEKTTCEETRLLADDTVIKEKTKRETADKIPRTQAELETINKIHKKTTNIMSWIKIVTACITVSLLFIIFYRIRAHNLSISDNSEFRLGGVAPMTGEAGNYGTSAKQGIELAVQEWNAQGGVLGKKIKLFMADDKGDRDEGAIAYAKLIHQDKVTVIVGPVMSKVALAGAPIAQTARVPMISPTATNPAVTQVGNYIFRACFIDTFQGTLGAKFSYDSLKAKRAACLFDVGNGYTVGLSQFFKDKFTSLGGEVVAFEGHVPGTTDFRAQLTKIFAFKPEVLYVSDYYNDATIIAVQARKLGYKGPIVGGDGWDSPELAKIGGAAIEGCFYTNHFAVDSFHGAVQVFVTKFRATYGVMPDAISALAYDATHIILNSVKNARKADSESIRDALAATDLEVVTGHVKFDANRNPIKPGVIIQILKGRPIFHTTLD